MSSWWVFKGEKSIEQFLQDCPPPPWRQFTKGKDRGANLKLNQHVIDAVNAAIYLRRPLLVTGTPGSGKTSLAYTIASALNLEEVLLWPINTRSTLREALYRYDAIGRLQEVSLRREQYMAQHLAQPPQQNDSDSKDKITEAGESPLDIGRYMHLGPLGTAFVAKERPRVLLIDEIDKSDIDLPNDLLNIFEEGQFEIPELTRLPEGQEFDNIKVRTFDRESRTYVLIERGQVRCSVFPIVVLTSNDEREFPPAFLRRCLRLKMPDPRKDAIRLKEIVRAYLQISDAEKIESWIEDFIELQGPPEGRVLATDQLLNAVFLALGDGTDSDRERLRDILLQSLSTR